VGVLIRDAVLEALDNAVASGHRPQDQPSVVVALDLAACDADLEDVDPDVLVPFVDMWKRSRS
jgi:hypothetical protein